MTEKMIQLDRLARRARAEASPGGDVRWAVTGRLRAEARRDVEPLAVFATGYAAVALVAVGFAVVMYNRINDPLSAMFQFGGVISP